VAVHSVSEAEQVAKGVWEVGARAVPLTGDSCLRDGAHNVAIEPSALVASDE
jgi:hypothetical protein